MAIYGQLQEKLGQDYEAARMAKRDTDEGIQIHLEIA